MPMSYDLSRDDCSRLLKAGVAGRVAIGTPDGPHIVPVNYAVDAAGDGTESILVRRSDGFSYAVIANGNGINTDNLGRDMVNSGVDWGTGTPI